MGLEVSQCVTCGPSKDPDDSSDEDDKSDSDVSSSYSSSSESESCSSSLSYRKRKKKKRELSKSESRSKSHFNKDKSKHSKKYKKSDKKRKHKRKKRRYKKKKRKVNDYSSDSSSTSSTYSLSESSYSTTSDIDNDCGTKPIKLYPIEPTNSQKELAKLKIQNSKEREARKRAVIESTKKNKYTAQLPPHSTKLVQSSSQKNNIIRSVPPKIPRARSVTDNIAYELKELKEINQKTGFKHPRIGGIESSHLDKKSIDVASKLFSPPPQKKVVVENAKPVSRFPPNYQIECVEETKTEKEQSLTPVSYKYESVAIDQEHTRIESKKVHHLELSDMNDIVIESTLNNNQMPKIEVDDENVYGDLPTGNTPRFPNISQDLSSQFEMLQFPFPNASNLQKGRSNSLPNLKHVQQFLNQDLNLNNTYHSSHHSSFVIDNTPETVVLHSSAAESSVSPQRRASVPKMEETNHQSYSPPPAKNGQNSLSFANTININPQMSEIISDDGTQSHLSRHSQFNKMKNFNGLSESEFGASPRNINLNALSPPSRPMPLQSTVSSDVESNYERVQQWKEKKKEESVQIHLEATSTDENSVSPSPASASPTFNTSNKKRPSQLFHLSSLKRWKTAELEKEEKDMATHLSFLEVTEKNVMKAKLKDLHKKHQSQTSQWIE